jgi:mannose-6-phosphate isomerase-like protein (cupin superfamily)
MEKGKRRKGVRYLSVAVIAALGSLGVAQAPEGFDFWSSAQLRSYEKKLAPKINAQKVATEILAKYGNHLVMVAHRQGDGEAELHEKQADIFIVESGGGTLIVGGKVVGGKTTAPGEIRGPSIEGGQKRKIGPGDVIHIPARTAHQTVLDGARQITYVIVKIDE